MKYIFQFLLDLDDGINFAMISSDIIEHVCDFFGKRELSVLCDKFEKYVCNACIEV